MSDQRLAELLSDEGVTVARRTVAKYREELHIEPILGEAPSMSPERAELPQRPPSAAPQDAASGSAERQDGHRSRAVVIIVVMVVFVVAAARSRRRPVSGGVPLVLLYRHLYYIPIIYAAFVFGKRGGALTALAASIPFAIHAQVLAQVSRWGSGSTTGSRSHRSSSSDCSSALIRDTEEHRTRDLRQVSLQLEDAYKKLEERAIQLINIQDYTQSILRSITSGVLTVGPDGSVATANPAAERMLGMSEFEMVPRPIGSLFQSDGGISTRCRQGARGTPSAGDARGHARDVQRPGRSTCRPRRRACVRWAVPCWEPSSRWRTSQTSRR